MRIRDMCMWLAPCSHAMEPLAPCSPSALHEDFKLQLQLVRQCQWEHPDALSRDHFRSFAYAPDNFLLHQTPALYSHAVRTRQVPPQHVKDDSSRMEPTRPDADC
jgi:hypothetical protein